MAIEFLDDVKVEAGLEVTGTLKDSNGAVGTSGQVLSSTVSGTDWVDAGGVNIGDDNLVISDTTRTLTLNAAGAAASNFTIKKTNGTDTIIQFSDGATLINDTFILTNNNINVGGAITLREAGTNGQHHISLNAPYSLAANNAYILPNAFPTSDKVLQSSSTGAMSWVAAGSGGGTNIANTNLTADASRTLTLGGYSLSFLDSNADNIAVIQATGNQFFGGTFSLRTNSATTAPTLRLSSGTSNNYTGIKSPDTLSGSTVYTLPTADGTSGQTLTTDGAGAMSWATAGAGSARSLITAGGGRILIGTSSDSGLRGLVLGGSIGFNYYNWTTQMRYSNIVNLSGLSTPGTTIENISPYYANQGAFQALASGDVVIQGTIEGPNSTDIYSQFLYIYVFKVPAAIVTAMGNGNAQNNTNYSLVASAQCRMPASSATTRPQSFISSNGVSVSQGDWIFAAVTFDAAVTSNRYFNINFQMYTS